MAECAKAFAAVVFTEACNQEKLLAPARPRPLAMGVSVFTGWASPRPEYGLVPGVQCPNPRPWEMMRTADRVPAIGQYDEANPAVTAWRLEQMQRGGVDWCTYQHDWSPNLGKLIMNHCAENHPADSPISFAASSWDVLSNSKDGGAYFADPRWTRDAMIESIKGYGRALKPLIEKASYLRIADRPVVFRGGAHSLLFYETWGLSPTDVLNLIAGELPERPYFVATACEHSVHPVLKSWGFDAFTEYALYGDSWDSVMRTYRDFWARSLELARSTSIDFWIPTLAGFDARGYLPDVDAARLGFFEPPNPAAFTAHLVEARELADRHYEVTRGRVLSYAWSEYYEGGVIEPMAPGALHSGDELLLAHRAAVGKAA